MEYELIKDYEEWIISKKYNDFDYTGYSEFDIRKIFFVEDFLGITNYGDESITIKLADEIINFIRAIYNGSEQQHELFAKDSIKYILYINLLENWINWGTSFCGCWFDGKFEYNDKVFKINNEFITGTLFSFLIGKENVIIKDIDGEWIMS